MSTIARSSSLWTHVVGEHRRVVAALVAGLVLNVVAYVAVVYPLGQQVANVEERNQAAERELVAAKADHARATGTLSGKDRATEELGTFYTTVLPRDFAGARRLTHLRVPQLARLADLRYESASVNEERARDSSLTRFDTEISLTGSWTAIRHFIHQLESDPGFVVIDNVQLTEGDRGGDGAIQVTLQLSTYYQAGQP